MHAALKLEGEAALLSVTLDKRSDALFDMHSATIRERRHLADAHRHHRPWLDRGYAYDAMSFRILRCIMHGHMPNGQNCIWMERECSGPTAVVGLCR